CDQHQREICCGPCKRHQRGTPRIPLLPPWIVWGTGPSNHPSTHHVRENRHKNHAERFPSNMRRRVEGYLSTVESGRISSDLRGDCVGGFMAGCGKQEYDVPDEP